MAALNNTKYVERRGEMNTQFKVDPWEHSVECVKEYLLSQIKKIVCNREIDVFKMQNKKKFTGRTDSEFVNWLNESTYVRCFSRIALRATLRNKWATITEVTTSLNCDPKIARNLYQKFFDHKMIDRDKTSVKLLFKTTARAVSIFDAYVKGSIAIKERLIDYLTDLLQFTELERKHGTH